MAASDSPADAFAAAGGIVPRTPGVYFFLGAGAELLYIGKAGDLRRRLHQHERAVPPGSTRGRLLYEQVREIRWEVTADEASAANLEADLIVGLRPPFNASHTGDGRWVYVLVRPIGDEGDEKVMQFSLARDASGGGGRAYGCFPHLGVGVSSRRAIACSEGYAAFLRLVWAASSASGHQFPSRISGPSPPETLSVRVDGAMRSALHAFLSGTSPRLLDPLQAAGAPRESFMQPALARDRASAAAFFEHGPRALRALRLRHRVPSGPMARRTIEGLLASDVRAAIGDFTIVELPDPTEGLLGARASKTASLHAARRAHQGGGTGS